MPCLLAPRMDSALTKRVPAGTSCRGTPSNKTYQRDSRRVKEMIAEKERNRLSSHRCDAVNGQQRVAASLMNQRFE